MTDKSHDSFHISSENWSLHRKGYEDQKRHQEKVQEAIQKNLPDLISEENIILSNGKEVVKIPIRSLDEYKIRYNAGNSSHVGQGNGKSKVGDVIAKEGDRGKAGKGTEPGTEPGEDYYEAEISLADIEKALFAELELPNLKRKEQADIVREKIEFNDIRRKGLIGNIDKKQTLLSAIRRNALVGNPTIAPILQEDLRFKTWNDVTKPESKAVVLAMMDTSGSMGNFEKYIARSFFFWMTKFLRTKYETVEIEFIAHHTEAKVVSEHDFFHKGESGGTRCSSVYLKALQLIKNKYNPSRYNIYPFHFSDGENIASDNPLCIELVEEIMQVSNMFGYGEINAYSRYSTLMNSYKKIKNDKFRYYVLKEKNQVYDALKKFFKSEIKV